MKSLQKEILGFTVSVPGVAETLAEAIEAAGSEDLIRDLANQNLLNHSHFGKLRKLICDKAEETTGIKRETEEVDGKTRVVEKEAAFLSRVEEEADTDVFAQLRDAVTTLSENTPLSYTPPVRGVGGSAKPAAKWLAAVDELIEQDKFEVFCRKYGIDASQPEEELRAEAANKIKEVVTLAQRTALAAAMDV